MTQSGTELSQQYGRIPRLSPKTGKTRAVAVQFVDEYEIANQRPVLLTDLIDPNYIVRGSAASSPRDESAGGRRRAAARDDQGPSDEPPPIITVHGMHIDGIIEQAKSDALRIKKFETSATVQEMNAVFDDIIAEVQSGYDDTSVLELYRRIADAVPGGNLMQELQQKVLEAVSSGDREGRRAFLFLNMKAILSLIRPHFTDSEAQNENLVHSALRAVYENVGQIDPDKNVSLQIRNILGRNDFLEEVLVDDVSDGEIPKGWVRDRKSGRVITAVDRAVTSIPGYPFTDNHMQEAQLLELAGDLAESTGYPEGVIFDVVRDRHSRAVGEIEAAEEDWVFDTVMERMQAEAIQSMLATLSEREAGVIRLRFGLVDDGQPRTLDEVGAVYGISRERIRQIEAKAMGKLRHPERAKRLRDFIRE